MPGSWYEARGSGDWWFLKGGLLPLVSCKKLRVAGSLNALEEGTYAAVCVREWKLILESGCHKLRALTRSYDSLRH